MNESVDLKERLIRDYKNNLLPYFSTEEIEIISDILMKSIYDYKLEVEPRELSPIADCNDKIINIYSNCLVVEGKSPKTIDAYRYELGRLSSVLNKSFMNIGTYDIRYYLSIVKSRGVTSTTLENSRSNLSAFFRWMEAEGFIPKNPMISIKPIRTNPKKESPFLNSEIDAIRFACKNLRERAIIEVALSSGLRLEELCALKISDINLKTFEIYVRHGKGDKYRISYINELASKFVEKYLAERNDELDILFLSRTNGGDFFSKSGMYRLITGIGKRANVNNVHPHRFRKTMASGLASKGMPVHEIMDILGHTDINTTMRYVNINKAGVKSSYEKFAG